MSALSADQKLCVTEQAQSLKVLVQETLQRAKGLGASEAQVTASIDCGF